MALGKWGLQPKPAAEAVPHTAWFSASNYSFRKAEATLQTQK